MVCSMLIIVSHYKSVIFMYIRITKSTNHSFPCYDSCKKKKKRKIIHFCGMFAKENLIEFHGFKWYWISNSLEFWYIFTKNANRAMSSTAFSGLILAIRMYTFIEWSCCTVHNAQCTWLKHICIMYLYTIQRFHIDFAYV